MSGTSFYAHLVSKLAGASTKGPPPAEVDRYAQLEEKHAQLNAAFSKLSKEHTVLLRSISIPKSSVSQSTASHMCRKRTLLAMTADLSKTYSPWGQWEKISLEEYMRDSTDPRYAGLRQYRAKGS